MCILCSIRHFLHIKLSGMHFVLYTADFALSHYYLLLIPVFGLAGILLFVTIALLGFTIDKGWINIVLFYCNFLSFRGYAIALPRYGMHILFIPSSLISLQLGVGVCFYDGMTPLAKTGLQLVFPVYLYLFMVIFTLPCRRYYWLSKRFSPTTTCDICYYSHYVLCQHSDHMHHHTGKEDGVYLRRRSSVRWLTDPNQEYFRGYHTVLVLIAAVLMVICDYTISILNAQSKTPLPMRQETDAFLRRLMGSFQDKVSILAWRTPDNQITAIFLTRVNLSQPYQNNIGTLHSPIPTVCFQNVMFRGANHKMSCLEGLTAAS